MVPLEQAGEDGELLIELDQLVLARFLIPSRLGHSRLESIQGGVAQRFIDPGGVRPDGSIQCLLRQGGLRSGIAQMGGANSGRRQPPFELGDPIPARVRVGR